MGIGASIFLIAIGAILAFAVDVTLSGISLQVVGIILMIAGALGLILTMFIWGPRRRVAPGPADSVYEERVIRDRDVY